MPEKTTTRVCLMCCKRLTGRLDKKFCDEYCRNTYNNRLKADRNNYVRNINNILLTNRRIMEKILPGDRVTTKTTKEKLLKTGFHFKYYTHTYTNSSGSTYFYCYEYGYLPLENNWYLVVKEKR